MNILAICGSARPGGNTEFLLQEALAAAAAEGAETELFALAGKDIRPCLGCENCLKGGICIQKDDMQLLYEKLLAADGIIFGTPVYFYNMAAQCKTVIDRTMALGHGRRTLHNKAAGIVVVGGSQGNISAVKDLCFYFVSRKMLFAGYISAYGGAKGDVEDLPKCLAATRKLGKGMGKLVKMGFKYPPELPGSAIAYGTHTK
jgi:multimeric flavodoxin WrbA